MKTKKKAPIIRIKGFDGDWEQRKLGELGSFKNGMNFSKDAMGHGYAFVNLQNIFGKSVIDTEKLELAEASETQLQEYNLQEGDVLFVRSSVKLEGVGEAAIVPKTLENTTYSGFIIRFRDEFRLDNNFKRFVFSIPNIRKQIMAQATNSANKNISQPVLENLQIYLPQYEEQKAIGACFSKLDHLITLHQREIDRIVCLRKAMVEKMFPQNGADVPAVRFSRYKEPWRLCQFSEIFTERHIIDTISDEYPQLAFTIAEGVIRPEDKKTNKRDFLIIDKATKKYLQTEYDDIIYNPANVIYGAIHRNALGKGCVSPIYKIFYTDQDSTFMECIVRHPNFIKEISRSMEGTVKKLRTLKPKAFLEMSAYIAPTIEEQRQIGEYFRQMDRLIEIEKEELEKIKHIKSACLEKMFV
ncbi:MAG: restriction endonuclease subunit S [Lacrimispora saccharolytica]